MMQFFEKQRVDAIGQIGVSLQKILLFFMIFYAFCLFNGGLFSFLICLIGFIGAVKRNPRLLAVYYSVTVFLIFFFFIFAVASLTTHKNYTHNNPHYASPQHYNDQASVEVSPTSAPHYVSPQHYDDQAPAEVNSTSAPQYDSSQSVPSPTPTTFPIQPQNLPQHMRRLYRSIVAGANTAPTPQPSSSSSSSSPSSSSSNEESEHHSDKYFFVFEILTLFIYFFISYLKVKSLVLAHRMRRLILSAPILPVEAPEFESAPESIPEPSNKCAVEENEEDNSNEVPIEIPQQSYFTQPGYMPYAPIPMQYPGAPSMVPPPMMYGQYPVYYSFAPASASPQEPRSDKL